MAPRFESQCGTVQLHAPSSVSLASTPRGFPGADGASVCRTRRDVAVSVSRGQRCEITCINSILSRFHKKKADVFQPSWANERVGLSVNEPPASAVCSFPDLPKPSTVERRHAVVMRAPRSNNPTLHSGKKQGQICQKTDDVHPLAERTGGQNRQRGPAPALGPIVIARCASRRVGL